MAWDDKYKKQHNKRRRERYAEDEDYRKEQIRRASERKAQPRNEDGRLMKELNGAMVPVYKIGEIAEAVGVTVFRVRGAFQRGRLPESSFEGKHIYVTATQLELIKKAFAHESVTDEDMCAMLLDMGW